MIQIIAKGTFKPECVEKFKSLAAELVEKSRAEEGNISYRLMQDRNDPCVLMFAEEWRDQAAIDFHNATEHFTRICPQFEALQAKPMEVNLYSPVI